MKRKPRLLLVCYQDSTFVRVDETLLADRYDVLRHIVGTPRGPVMILRQLQLLAWLARHLPRASRVFCWFADYHSVLPALLARLRGIRCVIAVGGFDAARMPEYRYGSHSSAGRALATRVSCRLAHALVASSEFTSRELIRNTGPSFAAKLRTGLLGIEPGAVPAPDFSGKEDVVLCVSRADSVNQAMIKGLDRFAEAATEVPGVRFIVVGATGEAQRRLIEMKIANLEVRPVAAREELLRLYRSGKVICQFSRFEAFGMAVLEGMLAGCVPVSLQRLGTAELMAPGIGHLLAEWNVTAAAEAIRTALHSQPDAGMRTRHHVVANMGTARRRSVLLDALA